MEGEKQCTEVHQNKSEDFILLDNGDFHNKKVAPKVKVVINSLSSVDTAFMSKVRTTFLTFHLFIIPAFLGMILNQITAELESPQDEFFEELRRNVVIAFMAMATLVGLPLHLLALTELEEHSHGANIYTVVHQDANTQTVEVLQEGEMPPVFQQDVDTQTDESTD